jgi:GST-like protein
MYTLYGTTDLGAQQSRRRCPPCDAAFKTVGASAWEPASYVLARRLDSVKKTDGTVMPESAAILIHLGLTFPYSGLFLHSGPDFPVRLLVIERHPDVRYVFPAIECASR